MAKGNRSNGERALIRLCASHLAGREVRSGGTLPRSDLMKL